MNKTELNNKEQKRQVNNKDKFSAKYILSNFKAVKKFLSTLDYETDKKALERTENPDVIETNKLKNERENN